MKQPPPNAEQLGEGDDSIINIPGRDPATLALSRAAATPEGREKLKQFCAKQKAANALALSEMFRKRGTGQ